MTKEIKPLDPAINNFTPLEGTRIPFTVEEVSWDEYDKYQPPRIENGCIKFMYGKGFDKGWFSAQNIRVLEVQPDADMALIQLNKAGTYNGALKKYLIGVDQGEPWVAHIKPSLGTIEQALEAIKPAEVKRAEIAGLAVARQGDWFFVPVLKVSPMARPISYWYEVRINEGAEIETWGGLDDDHKAAELKATKAIVETQVLIPQPQTYVAGKIDHGHHEALILDDWHKAVQNLAIRNSRLHKRFPRKQRAQMEYWD